MRVSTFVFSSCSPYFVPDSELVRCLGLFNDDNPEPSSCQSLCVQVIISLWKPAVWLITLHMNMLVN